MDMRHVSTFIVLTCMVLATSCSTLHDKSMDVHLAEAAVRNNIAGVYRNVAPRNATMRIRDEEPIYWAALHGNEDMIDVLYNNGASLGYRSREGGSLAYVAASNGHASTAEKLVRLGAGASADLKRGANDYVIHQKAIAERNRQMQEAAMVFLSALLGGGGGGGGGCEICGAPVDWSGRWCSQHGSAVHGQMQSSWPR